MFCRNCGAEVKDDWKICPNCGKVIVRSIAQQIDPVAYERVAMVLKNLRKGQALTVGDIEKAGHKIGGPIVTMSQLLKEKCDCLGESDLGESR